MERINFEVGAKAARLIGRENITDVDGALIELIKNAYDADASCVCVWFDMPFPYVPTEVSAHKLQQILNEMWVHSPPLGAQANFNRIEKHDTM